MPITPLRNSPTASIVTFTFLDISLPTLEASYFLLILAHSVALAKGPSMLASRLFVLGLQPCSTSEGLAVILLYRANLACVSRKQGRTWGASRIFAHDDYDQKENILPSWLDTSISWRHRGARLGLAVGWVWWHKQDQWTRPCQMGSVRRFYFQSAGNKPCLQKSGFSNFRLVKCATNLKISAFFRGNCLTSTDGQLSIGFALSLLHSLGEGTELNSGGKKKLSKCILISL